MAISSLEIPQQGVMDHFEGLRQQKEKVSCPLHQDMELRMSAVRGLSTTLSAVSHCSSNVLDFQAVMLSAAYADKFTFSHQPNKQKKIETPHCL